VVGYFGANQLVRIERAQLTTSHDSDDALVPTTYKRIGVEALVTDLTIDEAGNLWLPGGDGALYEIERDQLSEDEPTLRALRGAGIGSAEKLTFDTVPGPLFIAPENN